MNLVLRPATEADFGFLMQLRAETMTQYLEQNGLSTDLASHAQRIRYRFEFANIVQVDETPVGLFKYYFDDDHYTISQIQIMRSHGGLGLGTRLIKELLARAAEENKLVTLSVLRSNPAKNLYERLGFQVVGVDEHEYFMEKKPNKAFKHDAKNTRAF